MGERQAPIIRDVGIEVRKIRKAKRAVMDQEKAIIGPRNQRMEDQCRKK